MRQQSNPHPYAALGYRQPLGLPLRWQDDVTGRLQAAMQNYIASRVDRVPLSQDDFHLVRSYLEYLVNAPCWRECEDGRPLARYRRQIRRCQTPEELDAWIASLLDIGIDPL